MIKKHLHTLLLVLSCGACASSTQSSPPVTSAPVPVARTPEERLRSILHAPVLQDSLMRLDTVERALQTDFTRELATIVRDRTQPAVVRGNALLLLGDRSALDHVSVFAEVVADTSVFVRTSAAAGLHNLLISGDTIARSLLVAYLHDRDDRVQAKALESLGDRETDILRMFVAEQPPPKPQLREVALQLIETAEDRGAPLKPDANGVMTRVSHGYTLRYEPERTWPAIAASVGKLRVGKAGAAELQLVASDVEVVRNVLPAFVSPDSTYLVYEAARHIHVRNLKTGADRDLGEGSAPRPLPFTSDFIYMREIVKSRTEDQTRAMLMFYDVMRVPFDGSASSKSIEQTRVESRFPVNGGYSPVRWMRVYEVNGTLRVEGQNLGSFRLPDPFNQKQR